MKRLKDSYSLILSFVVLAFSCADPVSTIVAKKKSQDILDSFNAIDAGMRKSDSATNQFHRKSMQKIDSLNRIIDSLNKK